MVLQNEGFRIAVTDNDGRTLGAVPRITQFHLILGIIQLRQIQPSHVALLISSIGSGDSAVVVKIGTRVHD